MKEYTEERILKNCKRKFRPGRLELMMRSTPGSSYYMKEEFYELIHEMEMKYQWFIEALQKPGAVRRWKSKSMKVTDF